MTDDAITGHEDALDFDRLTSQDYLHRRRLRRHYLFPPGMLSPRFLDARAIQATDGAMARTDEFAALPALTMGHIRAIITAHDRAFLLNADVLMLFPVFPASPPRQSGYNVEFISSGETWG